MGNLVNKIPAIPQTISFRYVDPVTDREFHGSCQIDPVMDHDGRKDIQAGYSAHLLEAFDEKGQAFVDYGVRLEEEFENAALETFYKINTPAPLETPRVMALEVEANGLTFCAVAYVSKVPCEDEPGESYTRVEYPSGAFGPDGKSFDPYSAFVNKDIEEALHLEAVSRFRNQ